MVSLKFVCVLALVIVVGLNGAQSKCVWRRIRDRYIKGNNNLILDGRTPRQCALVCITRGLRLCKSFDYSASQKKCWFSALDDTMIDLSVEKGSDLYVRKCPCPSPSEANLKALWPMTSDFKNPMIDLTGNGHDGILNEPSWRTRVPYVDSRCAFGTEFMGRAQSYAQVPLTGLMFSEFSYYSYIFPERPQQGPLFQYDTVGAWRSHIWQFRTSIFFRPVFEGRPWYRPVIVPGLHIKKWNKIWVSFSLHQGAGIVCVNKGCRKFTLVIESNAIQQHRVTKFIRMGAGKYSDNRRFYRGGMACVALFNKWYPNMPADLGHIDRTCARKEDLLRWG